MSRQGSVRFEADGVFALTDKGNAELKSPGTSLPAAELQILVLLDGKATVGQIGQMASNLNATEVSDMLRKFYAGALITTATEPSSDGLESGFFSINVPAGFFSNTTPEANAEAEQGVSSLKQKGYYVRIARRAAKRELKAGPPLSVLVVDDDPDLVKLLRTFLKMEGWVTPSASNRAEVLAAFRQPTRPDVVLLDVQLPDINGFDLLAKMRQHPTLKSVPVIMLTAEATREAVLKGLLGGADGYVTKPFEHDVLILAVKEVLGLGGEKEARPAAKPG